MRIVIVLLCLSTLLPGLDRRAAEAELIEIASQVQRLSRAFNLIHELTRPSVVDIHIRTAILSPFRRQLLREVPVGEGSGFVFATNDTHAFVLTNAHVCVKSDESGTLLHDRYGQPVPFEAIRIQTYDNRILTAEFIGADTESDLAVLRIEAPELPPVHFADSDQARVGDWVVALGFPLGVGYSASSGIVSAIARSTDNDEHNLEAFIQTDAAINPGNSGGPLLNLNGEVIGVNTRIISRTKTNIGLGFAIPANLARRVSDDLKTFGRVFRPMFGFQMRPLQPGEAERLAIPNPEGVVVILNLPGTPAAAAGLQTGDVILEMGGVRITGISHLQTLIASARIGEAQPVTIWRQGETSVLNVTPKSREEVFEDIEQQAAAFRDRELLLRGFGLTIGIDDKIGVVVRVVEPGSPAASAGIQRGDRIIAVKGYGSLQTPDELASLAATNERLVCNVYRAGRTAFVVLER